MSTVPTAATQELNTSKAIPLLILMTLLAYASSFNAAFVLDDSAWITANADLVHDPLGYLSFGSRPVVSASLVLNHRLGGFNPLGYHAFNVTVHLLAGLALYGLVRRVLLVPRFAGRYTTRAPYLAFAVALLWLVHPLQTQAVTYVIQRCESMMGLFYFFTFYAWLRGAQQSASSWFVAGLTSFALSCGCKEVALTLPVLLVLFDRIFLANSWRELIRSRALPYGVLLVIWAIALVPVMLMTMGGGNDMGVGFGIKATTPFEYLLTQSEVILHYVRQAIWPTRQVLDYIDWPIASSLSEVLPAFLLVSALLIASLVLLVLWPPVGFLGFWFFAILAPTSSIVPIIDPVFEHRMYLSLAAIIVGMVFAFDSMIRMTAWTTQKQAMISMALLMLVAFLFTAKTVQRNNAYHSHFELLKEDLVRRPNNLRMLSTMASIYLNANDLERAATIIHKVENTPGTAGGGIRWSKAGWFAQSGRLDEAIALYREILDQGYDPYASPILTRNLAWVLIAQGQSNEAVTQIRLLLDRQPGTPENLILLAAAELAAGRETEARSAAEEAGRLAPELPRQEGETARAFVFRPGQNRTRMSRSQARWLAAAACLADQNQDPVLLDTLALACSQTGEFAAAATAARQGIAAAEARGDSEWAEAHHARLKYYEQGKPYRKEP